MTEEEIDLVSRAANQRVMKNVGYIAQDISDQKWSDMKNDPDYLTIVLPLVKAVIEAYEEVKQNA